MGEGRKATSGSPLALVGEGLGMRDELILERLVALNAECAEEERNGLIRWVASRLSGTRRSADPADH